jgi:gliding motility-associated-like protein
MRLEIVTFLMTFVSLFLLPNGERGHENRVYSTHSPIVQGIVTDGGYSVEELVTDIFVNGACETISNVNSIGNSDGIGYFENGGNIIGLENGIILSTGEITSAKGPNDASDTSGNFDDASGDPDLDSIAIEDVFDAVGIEFDFEPLDSFVTFRYVFASEEYCEFVASDYNDVFGFFVSGPGINGGFTGNAENVALIPGTNSFVTINTVNRTTNSNFYIGNERPENADECEVPYVASQQNNIEYDGFTIELTALLKVHPCETYHIRMVIGDVKDNFYDSAVFLEAKSFNLGGEVALSAVGTEVNGEQIISEGCDDAYFLIEREEGASTDFPLTVNFYLSTASTATQGDDYDPIPQSVIIPVNASSISVPVSTLNDDLLDSGESITLVLDIPCACYSDSASLIIVEQDSLKVNLPDIYICENGMAFHGPNVQDGNPPYTYLWSTGDVTDEISIPAVGADHYIVTVFDACGHFGVDSCQINITQAPTANLLGEASVCEEDTAFFQIVFTGIPPFDLVYTINGEEQLPIPNIESDTFELPAFQEGTYALVQLNNEICSGSVSGTAYLDIMEIEAVFTKTDVSCNGNSDGSISVEIEGANPPFLINWSDNLGTESQLNNLSAGVYSLTVQDSFGCTEEYEVPVTEPMLLEGIEVDCESFTAEELIFNVSGGSSPYLFAVDDGNFQTIDVLDGLVPGEMYLLTIQDANGCQFEQDFIMPVVYDQVLVLPEALEVLVGEEFPIIVELNIPESLLESVIWAPSVNLSCTDCLNPVFSSQEEGKETYFIQVTDIFGCRTFASIDIIVKRDIDYFVPTIFSPDGDQVNDFFLPYFSETQVTRILLFQVFNRWGGMTHEAKNFAPNTERRGWDGTLNGQELNSGVFVFLIKIRLRDGREKIITGDVVLIR